MRIPYDAVRDGLPPIQTAAERMAAAQQQIATGRRLNSVADDPLAAAQAVREHATIGASDAYTRTGDAAAARLSVIDQVLASFLNKVSSAIVAGVSGQGSQVPQSARDAAAAEVRGLRDSLVSDINTTFNGTYVFSGSRTTTPAYAQSGGVWTYQGDGTVVQSEIDRGQLVSTTLDGQAIAQGSASADVFTVLDNLATALEAGDPVAIGAALTELDAAFARASRAQGRLGADERVLDETRVRIAARRQAADIRRSTLEDANMAEAISRFTQTQEAYRAALASVSSAERLSLLDYLR
jgi:flagellar hook-associated protein 3 FlgL